MTAPPVAGSEVNDAGRLFPPIQSSAATVRCNRLLLPQLRSRLSRMSATVHSLLRGALCD